MPLAEPYSLQREAAGGPAMEEGREGLSKRTAKTLQQHFRGPTRPPSTPCSPFSQSTAHFCWSPTKHFHVCWSFPLPRTILRVDEVLS